MVKNLFIFIIISLILVSCKNKNNNTHINSNFKNKKSFFSSNGQYNSIDEATQNIADQLLFNIPRSYHKNNKYVITTFVNLNEFTKTSNFGRILGESLINELHTRRFKIIDFRAKESILVNKFGEFSLTRDVLKLKDEMPESLIVVGTYSTIENDSIVINARIINNFSSDVISTAKVIYNYKDCKQLNLCKKIEKKPIIKIKTIPIIEDIN